LYNVTCFKDETKNPKKKQMLREKCLEIMQRCEQIKAYLKKKEEVAQSNPGDGATKSK
jgi:hypothetical protein